MERRRVFRARGNARQGERQDHAQRNEVKFHRGIAPDRAFRGYGATNGRANPAMARHGRHYAGMAASAEMRGGETLPITAPGALWK
jgi:hypothetical protein